MNKWKKSKNKKSNRYDWTWQRKYSLYQITLCICSVEHFVSLIRSETCFLFIIVVVANIFSENKSQIRIYPYFTQILQNHVSADIKCVCSVYQKAKRNFFRWNFHFVFTHGLTYWSICCKFIFISTANVKIKWILIANLNIHNMNTIFFLWFLQTMNITWDRWMLKTQQVIILAKSS